MDQPKKSWKIPKDKSTFKKISNNSNDGDSLFAPASNSRHEKCPDDKCRAPSHHGHLALQLSGLSRMYSSSLETRQSPIHSNGLDFLWLTCSFLSLFKSRLVHSQAIILHYTYFSHLLCMLAVVVVQRGAAPAFGK